MSLLVFVFFLYTLSLSNNLTIMFVYSMKMASNKVDKKKKTYCPGTPNIGFLFFFCRFVESLLFLLFKYSLAFIYFVLCFKIIVT